MNRYQKIAWFNLVVIATTILVTSVAIAVEFHLRGYSSIGWLAIGILVLLKFALPLIAFGGGLLHKTACSVAILAQYGRGGRDE